MPKRPKKKQYSFPILKTKEIIKCMNELSIDLNIFDLKEPTEERCKKIYGDILSKLMSIHVTKNIKNDKINNNNFFFNLSLHEQSIINILLFRNVIRFMVIIGVEDFGISDIINPNSQRTITNLSAIINFAKYLHHKYEIYQNHKKSLNDLEINLNKIVLKNGELANKFQIIHKIKKEEEPITKKIKKQINEIKNEYKINNEIMEKQGIIIHQIKKKIKLLKTNEKEKLIILNKNIDKIDIYESQIVHSPKRIRNDLKSMSKYIQKEEIFINKININYNYDFNKFNQFKILQQLIIQRINEMKEIKIMINKYISFEKEIKILKTEKHLILSELKSIKKKEIKIKENLFNKKDEYKSIKIEKQDKEQKVNQLFDKIEIYQNRQMIQIKNKMKEIENYDLQIKTKTEQIENIKQFHINNINQIQDKYKNLSNLVNQYHYKMRQHLENW